MDYQDFLEHKIKTSPLSGFQVERDEINPMVFEFQKDTIIWGYWVANVHYLAHLD